MNLVDPEGELPDFFWDVFNKNWKKFFTEYEKINSKPTAEEIITFMKQVMKETFNIDIQ